MTKTQLPFEALNGGLDGAILVGKKPGYAYADGKRQGDTPVSWKYDVLLPGNSMSHLTVSVEGSKDRLASIADITIAEGCRNLDFILVRLVNCIVTIYAIDGLKMSAVAEGITMIQPDKQ